MQVMAHFLSNVGVYAPDTEVPPIYGDADLRVMRRNAAAMKMLLHPVCIVWLNFGLVLINSPGVHFVQHTARASRILDRITNFIASNSSNESKAKLLAVLMNVSDAVPLTNSTENPHIVLTPGVTDMEQIGGEVNETEAIDNVLMDAAVPGTAFNEPELLAGTDIVKFDGDILMQIEQFAKIQRNVTLDLFGEALEKNLGKQKKNMTLLSWIESLMPLSRKERAARRDSRRVWQNGIVPIRIDSNRFRNRHKRRIAKSMNRISENTCICFDIISKAEALAHKPHIRIIDGNGCRSYVGYSVRWRHGYLAQDLVLGQRCRRSRISTHELLHAIGLFHEQSRPDRDKYVDIKFKNVIPRTRGNFNRFSYNTINSRGVPYDFRSIMHYSNRAFSVNGEYTIIPKGSGNKEKYLRTMGRTRFMSRGDKQVVNIMYNCPSRTSQTRPSCPDYPYVFPPNNSS
ncbi:protein SpAN-like [Ylistrum balloti]|uniref:protein SpAN-like n=1 Tax=Ylistrum balloti TaxID=509963 RepID=UPI0029058A0D|nr:protein SpAN-like [Ylistrum balloti]